MLFILPMVLILFVMAIIYTVIKGTVVLTILSTLGAFAIIAICLLT